MDFTHPYFWAGFTLVGNGSLRVKSTGYEKARQTMETLQPEDGLHRELENVFL